MEIVCDITGEKLEAKPRRDGTPRLPRGWKRLNNQTFAPKAWQQRFATRSIMLPVAKPISRDGETWENIGDAWDHFRSDLKEAWSLSTAIANWTVRELAKADHVRKPSDVKMPKFAPPYLYPAARVAFPDMPTNSLCSLLQSVQNRYMKKRFETVWTSSASLPSHRYPEPFPVKAGTEKFAIDPDGRMLLSFRLGNARWTVQLRGGPGYSRYYPALKALAAGELKGGALRIGRRLQGDSHRATAGNAQSGGGQFKKYDVVVFIPVAMPRQTREGREGTMMVTAGNGRLFSACVNGDEPWVIHADHLRHMVSAHAARLDRLSDDRKHETRRPRDRRRKWIGMLDVVCDKHRRRLDSAIQKAVAALVNYADRRNVKVVCYSDKDAAETCSLPWFNLRERIKQGCEMKGIEFVHKESADAKANDTIE